MEYYERPVGSKEAPEHATVSEGQMVFTGPGTEHTTIFPVETILVCMSLRPRDHDNHEADLVRCDPLPIAKHITVQTSVAKATCIARWPWIRHSSKARVASAIDPRTSTAIRGSDR